MTDALTQISSMTRLAVWAGGASRRVAALASALRSDARYLESMSARLDSMPEEDVRHLAAMAHRLSRMAGLLADWAEALVVTTHSASALIALYHGLRGGESGEPGEGVEPE